MCIYVLLLHLTLDRNLRFFVGSKRVKNYTHIYLDQINIKVRVIKSGLQNGTVTVMWEKVEKANEYRVGIVPRDAILGTGKYNGTDLEATLTGLNPTKEYKGN